MEEGLSRYNYMPFKLNYIFPLSTDKKETQYICLREEMAGEMQRFGVAVINADQTVW